MGHIGFLWVVFIWLTSLPWAQAAEPNILPPDQAFRFQFNGYLPQGASMSWEIADGYYLYRKAFRFKTKQAGVQLAEAELPKGQIKHDEFFGDSEIYRGRVGTLVRAQVTDPVIREFPLEVTWQGCADVGICYPPERITVTARLPAAGAPARDEGRAILQRAFGTTPPAAGELLPEQQAFDWVAEVHDARKLQLSWRIADGYYLYRDKMAVALTGSESVRLGTIEWPEGVWKDDPEFGRVQVYTGTLTVGVPLERTHAAAAAVRLTANFQGCEARRGVCYPPMERTAELQLPPLDPQALTAAPEAEQSATERIAGTLRGGTLAAVGLSFFGFGLLLAFTPCILPMIPILSGIIAGHGGQLTGRSGFLLALTYVLASALTYTVFGMLAGLFGANLQVVLQAPAVVVAFSLVFVALALAMFGVYQLQLPTAWQSRLTMISRQQHGGRYVGVAVMGVLSTLIVGPCVAAPLAGALLYIGQSGSPVKGGIALFALGLGMGAPLLALGASAGRWLPRAGRWMDNVKAVFGIGLLVVAIWLLDRVLPAGLMLVLWGLLCIGCAMLLRAVDDLPAVSGGWPRLGKAFGVALLAWGVLLLIGAASGGRNPLQPLQNWMLPHATVATSSPAVAFRKIRDGEELDAVLRQAAADGRWVLLDFYADWCVSCKEMEQYTFGAPEVAAQLSRYVLVQADVTRNTPADRALLQRFGLIGPPATLLFGPNGQERKAARVIGYLPAAEFLRLLRRTEHG